MTKDPRPHRGLHRFALLTAVSTFFLIVAGGLVTSTGSGLAVPDWPLSYGQLMPPMVGGILYEHGHRMIATFVGFLTVILAVWLWKKEQRQWLRWLGVIAVAVVILQGILGGLTVIYLLPTAISVSHATLAQTFFCLMATIALFTSEWWHRTEPAEPGLVDHRTVRAMALLVGVMYIQLILGALMRHTESGLAVPDFPLAYGFLIPPLDSPMVQRYNEILLQSHLRIFADGPVSASQILIHMLHRFWALVVVGAAIWILPKALRLGSLHPRIRTIAVTICLLLVAQIALGALTVLLRKDIWITTAHVANGALLLGLSVVLVLASARVIAAPEVSMFGVFTRRKEALA